MLGRDGFQEADIAGVSLPVTKHNYLITKIQDLPDALKEAFYIARTGRPGPVLVDIAKTYSKRKWSCEYPTTVNLPGYDPALTAADADVHRPGGPPHQRRRAAGDHRRPRGDAGQGHRRAAPVGRKDQYPRRFAACLGIGALPATHPLSMGMGGMHGEAYTNYAIQECDILVSIGSRLDDRLTGAFSSFAPKARIIHIDLDPAEVGKTMTIDTPVIGDALLTLRALLPQVEPKKHPDWLAQIAEWRGDTDRRDLLAREADELVPPYIMRELWYNTDEGNCIVVTDVGQHQMWEAQYFPHIQPLSLITSGGLGTMGFALPAAIGAQMSRPDEEVWVVAGDGGFQMTMPELSTVAAEGLPIKIAIINNGYLGMVRQWQDIFYEQRYAGTPLFNPDFVKIAEAYGIPALTVNCKERC